MHVPCEYISFGTHSNEASEGFCSCFGTKRLFPNIRSAYKITLDSQKIGELQFFSEHLAESDDFSPNTHNRNVNIYTSERRDVYVQ